MGNSIKLLISIFALLLLMGNAQLSWVSLKSTEGGALSSCVGNGTTDDTACIQAHIDYAYSHSIYAVYCPAGTYKTGSTLFLDPPANLRSFTFQGYISNGSGSAGTTLTLTSGPLTGLEQMPGNEGVATPITGGTAGTHVTGGSGTSYTVDTSQLTGSAGSPVTFTASNFQAPPFYSFHLSFFGDPTASPLGGGVNSCVIQPTANSYAGMIVGPGQGMYLANFAIQPPNTAYRGQQPRGGVGGGNGACSTATVCGVGIGMTGTGGGSHDTYLMNTTVSNYFNLYMTNANDGCCLSDTDIFINPQGKNGYRGIFFYQTQTFGDDIENDQIVDTTVGIDASFDHQTNVYSGNLEEVDSNQNTFFTWSSTSNVTSGCPGEVQGVCIQATITNSDTYLNGGSVYSAFEVLTPDAGVIPMVLAAYNSTTHVAQFLPRTDWIDENYGKNTAPDGLLPLYQNVLISEILAAPGIYASEVQIVAQGSGLTIEGMHFENPGFVCMQFLNGNQNQWGGAISSELRNPYFNSDISYPVPSTAQTAANFAASYCQRFTPVVLAGNLTNGIPSITIKGGNWGYATLPVLLEAEGGAQLRGVNMSGNHLNVWADDTDYGAYGNVSQLRNGNQQYQFATVSRGAGLWDNDYFLPMWFGNFGISSGDESNTYPIMMLSALTSPFCGFSPCASSTPNLDPAQLYPLVSGSLGALGSYPMISCNVAYQSVAWNSGNLSGSLLRSASCPGFSWGQNLTAALVNTSSSTNAVVTGAIGATATASSSGTTALTLTSITGTIHPGTALTAALSGSCGSLPAGTYIVSGSAGSYVTNVATTCASISVTISSDIMDVSAGTSGTLVPGDQLTGTGVTTDTYIIQGMGSVNAATVDGNQVSASTIVGSQYTLNNTTHVASTTLTSPVGTWSYRAGTDVLYLDASTLQWMFPGLGLSLDTGNSWYGPQPYIVTGIYPDLGYVTVIWAANPVGGKLQNLNYGSPPTQNLYSCSSACTIEQAPYEWSDPKRWVQGQLGNSFSVPSSYTLNLPNAVGNNHCVVGAVYYNSTTATVSSIVDNKSNSYTQIDHSAANGSGTLNTFYRCGITNAPTSITFTFSAAVQNPIAISDEFSGVTALDVHAMNFQSSLPSGSNNATSGTIAPQANDFVWGATVAVNSSGAAFAAGTSFATTHAVTGHAFDTNFSGVLGAEQTSSAVTAATFTGTAGDPYLTAAVALH